MQELAQTISAHVSAPCVIQGSLACSPAQRRHTPRQPLGGLRGRWQEAYTTISKRGAGQALYDNGSVEEVKDHSCPL